jgi:hypothetical protein
MHSLPLGLDSLPLRRGVLLRKAKGPSQRLFVLRLSLVIIGRKYGGRSVEPRPKLQCMTVSEGVSIGGGSLCPDLDLFFKAEVREKGELA